jgi:acyltransferase
MENETIRLNWIDTLKTIGIFFVLIGHKLDNKLLVSYIYAFHVPLFFFVSGYLFKYSKYRSFKYFLNRKIRTLIVPYFCFATTSYLFWLVIIRSLSIRGQSLAMDPMKPLQGIFYASGIQDMEIPLNIALWFIPCLFATETLFLLFRYFFSKGIILYICGLSLLGTVGSIGTQVMNIRMPWSIDVAFVAIVFFGVGHYIGKQPMRIFDLNNKTYLEKWFLVLISIALLIIHLKISILNGQADMYANYYGNFFYFFLGAFSGIGFYLILSLCIPGNWVSNFIGSNTLIIIGLNGNVLFIILGVMYLANKNVGMANSLSLFVAVVYSIMQIALLLPIIYIINKHMPFIIGRKKQHTKY